MNESYKLNPFNHSLHNPSDWLIKIPEPQYLCAQCFWVYANGKVLLIADYVTCANSRFFFENYQKGLDYGPVIAKWVVKYKSL